MIPTGTCDEIARIGRTIHRVGLIGHRACYFKGLRQRVPDALFGRIQIGGGGFEQFRCKTAASISAGGHYIKTETDNVDSQFSGLAIDGESVANVAVVAHFFCHQGLKIFRG